MYGDKFAAGMILQPFFAFREELETAYDFVLFMKEGSTTEADIGDGYAISQCFALSSFKRCAFVSSNCMVS